MITHRLKQIIGDRSQREFAKSLGISPSTLWEYLKGRTPPADFIARVCERENVSLKWLMRGEDPLRAEGVTPAEGTGILKAAEEMTKFEVSVRGYIAAHNRLIIEKMIQQLTSIINEGDYRKTGAIQSLLDVLAPQQKEGK
ncbi:MAG: helix-turn-helix domain-containing protein [Nitrospiraceae bacterium]|nr:helix-turn-helix domain-containing protein [Nitrospiraceae bacterium]